jgi:hypothetical protein
MPKPRLFFSHSTEDGSPDRAILMGLAEALEADYEILLDRKTLVAGSDWRSIINVWIGICDAAVILVTPGSIASDYCKYEWANLSFRREAQKKFLIIPIYYGSTPNEIKARADQISEIAGYFNFDNMASVTGQVKQLLVAELVPGQRAKIQISYVEQQLRKAIGQEEVIETVADKIALDLGTWDFSANKWLKFAVKIMAVGIGRAVPALRDLQIFFGRAHEEEFNDIIDLVGFCSWVDMRSAQRIKDRAGCDPSAQDPLGLNAVEAKTATSYVLSASERGLSNNWPIGIVLGVFANYEHLHQQVRSALLEALRLGPDADAAKVKRRVDALQEPIFVVLRADGLSAEWLKALRETELFASVNFLILTGQSGDTSELLPEDALLEPLLPDGFERKVWDTYDDAKEILSFA